MAIGRVAFGCVVDNYGERIFAIGGTLPKQQATDVCEEYLVEQDKWVKLPSLSEPKFSQSLCVFTDQWLYQFGGSSRDLKLSNKIERLNLQERSAWEIVSVEMPRALSSTGAF